MLDMNHLKFKADGPYPVIGEIEPNRNYANAMLSNIGGSNSEMSAISLYVYNHLYEELYSEEVATIFIKIAMVEMHHLDIFGTLAVRMGADPRLWADNWGKKVYWTPAYNNYPTDYYKLLKNSLEGEYLAIEKYQQQLSYIEDKVVRDCLRRIIEDEEVHVEIFQQLMADYEMK